MRHARSACIVARCTWSISAGLWGNTPTGQPCACVESHDRRQAYPTCPESTGACAVASAAKCTIENRSSCTCYSSSVRTTDSTSARLRTPSCGRPIHGVRADAIPWPGADSHNGVVLHSGVSVLQMSRMQLRLQLLQCANCATATSRILNTLYLWTICLGVYAVVNFRTSTFAWICFQFKRSVAM